MIEVKALVKIYRSLGAGGVRDVRALDGVDLGVERGRAVGIVGLNGAGKSTLLRTLLGFARPTSGEVRLGGLPPRGFVERNGVAYLPERVTIPTQWTVRGALRAYAMLDGRSEPSWRPVDRALDRLGLTSLGDRKVGTLSKGNLQRVAIAQMLLGNRKIMVLDEPNDGLDPLWIAEMRLILAEWREADPERVVMIASHDLTELQRSVDEVHLLHNGRIARRLPSDQPLENLFLEAIHELEEPRA